MSTPFQNRLVGTVMVAAAAVIFLPDLLDGKKEQFQADFEGIPQAPAVIDKPLSKPFPKEQLATIPKGKVDKEQALSDVFEKSQYNQPAQAQANDAVADGTLKVNTLTKEAGDNFTGEISKNSEQSSAVKEVVQEQWVVQLGSFRHEKNVTQLVNKLKDNGFKVFTKPIKTKNGSLTKVFVGPELVKNVLEKKLAELKALTKVEGKVARYRPTN